jgi:3-dehydroquinate synthase II
MAEKIFFKAIPFDKKLITLALESGVDGIVAEPGDADSIRALGRTQVLTEKDLTVVAIEDKTAEKKAAGALEKGGKVLISRGWEIIPMENLLAVGKGELGAEAESPDRARLAAGVLERGVDFIVITPEAAPELKTIMAELKLSRGEVELSKAKVTRIESSGLGHRVCVDTLSVLSTGQGMLSGNSSSFMFLVNAETESNPYVAARPFRINAGAVHAYARLPEDKTSYLEELSAGSEVLVVGHDGTTRVATVGRVKIEVRPMLLIEAESENGAKGAIFLQNAETIRLVRPGGEPVSVVNLKVGDEILASTDEAGRHFGMRIKEEIKEG